MQEAQIKEEEDLTVRCKDVEEVEKKAILQTDSVASSLLIHAPFKQVHIDLFKEFDTEQVKKRTLKRNNTLKEKKFSSAAHQHSPKYIDFDDSEKPF